MGYFDKIANQDNLNSLTTALGAGSIGGMLPGAKPALNKVTQALAKGRDKVASIGQNAGLKEAGAKLGFGKTQAQKDAEKNLATAKSAYSDLNPPSLTPEKYAPIGAEQSGTIHEAQALGQGASNLGGVAVNPADREAQMDQLAALKNLAANGGRSAASDADLASIQMNEGQQARGQRDAALQNAAARGMSGSGASLLAQLSGNQAAQNQQSIQDMQVRGQDQNQALQAGMGAANIGSQMENTDYTQQANKAAANDAIARFNAGQQTSLNQANAAAANQNQQYNTGLRSQANQFNAANQIGQQQYNTGLQQTGYQNQFQKQAGVAGANMAGMNYNSAQAGIGAQQMGNILGGASQLGTAYMKAATGGRIPGIPSVSGNSSLNDFVPIKASPGEVVVPRTLALGGSSDAIASFVKHPPQVKPPNQDREAMLSALRNIRSKRGF